MGRLTPQNSIFGKYSTEYKNLTNEATKWGLENASKAISKYELLSNTKVYKQGIYVSVCVCMCVWVCVLMFI